MSEMSLRPATQEGIRPFGLEWWMPLVVFVMAWVIRLCRLAYITNFIDDRYLNVPSAFNFTERGLLGPDNWWTQPAKHVLLYWSIHLYGNDPVGWRMREVLFGSLAVLLVFLIARRLLGEPFPAFAAAVLYALDPLQIAFSRASSEDVPAVFFMLAGFLFWLRAVESRRFHDWLVTGLLLGTALALRIHILLVLVVLFGMSIWLGRKKGSSHVAGLA
ncbi:phospholipid carrier-dependent glycosyltransferase, partial [bacterium]|nr:phospholipid carrier-dependent glycosyltransferase [bacterium]